MEHLSVREATEADAAAYIALFEEIVSESAFLLFKPGERSVTQEEQRAMIRSGRESSDRVIFLAYADNARPIGFATITRGHNIKLRLTAAVVLGVLTRFSGRGVGAQLLGAVEAWARNCGAHRLELTVVEENLRAIALYRRMGFSDEGIKRENLRLGDRFVSELVMGKILT